jgi:hypothetical protein
MLKWLAIFALLAAVLPICAQQKGAPSGNNQYGAHAKNDAQPAASQPAVQINTVNQQASDSVGDWAKKHSQSYLSRLFSPEQLPNVALVIAGFAGIAVAILTLCSIRTQAIEMRRQRIHLGRTLLAIRRQARQMEEQSKAMEDQVKLAQQTIVHTQRPKIIVRTFYFSESSGTPPHNNGLAAGSFAKGQFYLVNIGGTRATVEEIWCEPYIGESLPGKRPYEGKKGYRQSIAMKPGESTYYLFSLSHPLEDLTASLLKGRSKSFFVLGWIGYRDDLGIYRSTRFCRHYNPSRDRFVPVEDDPDYESAE